MITINRRRFLDDLAELAQIGRLPAAAGGGLDRRPFSPAERAARAFFRERAIAAGLTVATDSAANLSARLPAADPTAPTLLLGSHLDTVPHGGPYDGALGVLAALEVARTLHEQQAALPAPLSFHVEAIAFTDEEGRFGDMFGSKAIGGKLTPAAVESFLSHAAAHPDDLQAMREVVPGGLAVEAVLAARRPPESLAGYLELHIEQGPQLERAGLPVGVVDAIFGRQAMQLDFYGRADHAGTTPIYYRADALAAAVQVAFEARNYVGHLHPTAVITCGDLRAKPGVYNVVPEQATLLVEFRAAESDIIDKIDDTVRQLAERVTRVPGLSVQITAADRQPPAAMAASMQAAIHAACRALGCKWLDLSSGAGHDAQSLADVTPTGMLFVPSKGGRSHTPDEDTAPDDLVMGANALLHAVIALANGAAQ